MITDLGRRNQARMCGTLGVEHIWVSADIKKKRENIRKNILAWMRKPDLGMVPLFMAGDKHYFSNANRLMKELNLPIAIYAENPLEKTDFKTGFCGVFPKFGIPHVYELGLSRIFRLATYYGRQLLANPAYLNQSLLDSATAFFASYGSPHNYLYLYRYVQWDEKKIDATLTSQYDWETAPDTPTTWRIGDGTAPLYNYIYYVMAGFTENDTFRSNQVREGIMARSEALEDARRENQPRWESLRWYCDTVKIDMETLLKDIHTAPKRYGQRK